MNIRNMAASVLVGTALSSASASGIPPGSDAGGPAPLLQTLVDLDLTVAQKHDIAAIVKTYRPALRVAVDDVIAARKALFEAIHADTFNEAAVRNASTLAAARETNLNVLRARLVADLKPVLTPEQRAVMQKHRAGAQSRLDRYVELARTTLDRWIDKTATN